MDGVSTRGNRRIVVLLSLIVLGAACEWSCKRHGANDRGRARPEASAAQSTAELASIGREIGLTFPPNARLVGVQRENGMDDLVALKVEMPLMDLAPFLRSTPVKPDDYANGERGLLGPDDSWWDPGKAPRLRTGQAILTGARALNIGIDDSRPDVAVLYIVNHGT